MPNPPGAADQLFITQDFRAFTKGEGDTKTRWFAGVASDPSLDRQGERVLQSGLDFTPFIEFGSFLNEHNDDPANLLGKGESAEFFKKGMVLPDGEVAKDDCWFVSGRCFNDPHSVSVWEKAHAARSQGIRQYGLSVHGPRPTRVRNPDGTNTITKASVWHVAVTGKPVNPNTSLGTLIKSMAAFAPEFAAVETMPLPGDSSSPAPVNDVPHNSSAGALPQFDPPATLNSSNPAVDFIAYALQGKGTKMPNEALTPPTGILPPAPSPSMEALSKSLDQFTAHITKLTANPPQTRDAELLAKAQSGSISADEKAELVKSLSGCNSLSGDLRKSFGGQPDLSGLEKSISTLSDALEKKVADQGASFQKSMDLSTKTAGYALAVSTDLVKAMAAQCELIKSLGAKIEKLAAQPVGQFQPQVLTPVPGQPAGGGAQSPTASVLSMTEFKEGVGKWHQAEVEKNGYGSGLSKSLQEWEELPDMYPNMQLLAANVPEAVKAVAEYLGKKTA